MNEPVVLPPDGAYILPAEVILPLGSMVRFVNFDLVPHHLVADDFTFDTGPLPPPVAGPEGGSFCVDLSFLTESAVIPYSCVMHPGAPEVGFVAVIDSAAITGVDAVAANGATLALRGSRPNPTRAATVIGFEVPAPGGPVELVLHDVAGRKVRTLLRESKSAGAHEATWDGLDDGGRPVPAGVYFARLGFEGRELRGRVVVLR